MRTWLRSAAILARKIRLAKRNRRRAQTTSLRKAYLMKSTIRALLAALLSVSSPSANASELIYSQLSDNRSTFGPSQLWSPNSVNSEIADEFNVTGNIDRISAGGFVWGAIDFQGVYIRFYAFGADNKPGVLQH